MLESPAIRAISLSHAAWRIHGTESSLDKAAVARIHAEDSASMVRLVFYLADYQPFELAKLHGLSLKAVIVPIHGQGGFLVSDVIEAVIHSEPVLIADLLAEKILSSLTGVGEHHVGLVPQQEVTEASSSQMPGLVSGDSQSLLVVDTSQLQIESLAETPTRLPTAPGLTNHLAFRVSVAQSAFGLDLATVIPMIGCALVRQSSDLTAVEHIYFSEFSIVLEDYDQTAPPPAIKIEFIIQVKQDIPHEAAYCVKLVFNGQLTDTVCDIADPIVTFFHLPPTIYSRTTEPCNVESELADYTHLDRNFASHLAVVNEELQYELSDGRLLCNFDPRVYDFLQQLYLIELHGQQPSPWSLQDVVLSAIATNVTHLALIEPGPQPTGVSGAGSVFIRSHLAEIVDAHARPDPTGLPTSGVYHPDEDLTIIGFFLDNSALGAVVRLTQLLDPTKVVRGVAACRPSG